ncbi:hypothetical protein ACFXGA_27125 [Actinosynnema sp. NPDC059335]|uniref:hypothetical protein n=1 Tax=Actinosynnema sp. NPDC059335 TaxID=3346804 RepID=UPI0036700919
MTLRERWRARRTRVACRDEYGHRGVIIPVPRSGGCGVELRTPLGTLVLTPLEVGHLREGLREKLLESAELLAAEEAAAKASAGRVSR